ncbi:MAG: hypothetical protein AAGA92_00780 [Planctomycetota bacterium]
MPLDAGTPNGAVQGALRSLSREAAFGHALLVDDDAADCCLAGVWLLHSYLDESHSISQGVSTPDGSYWHGVMHRREGDYSNAKYWFRRVGGDHPVFAAVAAACGDPRWSPAEFVDACEAAAAGGRGAERCVETQRLEWALLFEHCYRAALGDLDAAGP